VLTVVKKHRENKKNWERHYTWGAEKDITCLQMVKLKWGKIRALRSEEANVMRVCFVVSLRWNNVGVWTAVAQWLRCCATNRKVAGSIPAGVTGIFH